MNQCIPSPLNARVHEAVSSNDLLLKNRTFADVNHKYSRTVTTPEAHKLFVRVQHLNELNFYANYLKSHHDFQDEVALQMEEPGGDHVTQVHRWVSSSYKEKESSKRI